MIQRTLPAAGVAAVLLLLSAACLPVGEIQEENRVVERDGALSAKIDLFMNVGELRLQGGAEDLLDADFIYNVERWKPQIDYRVTGDRGRLTVRQGESSGIPVGNGRNRWEIHLTEDIPLDIRIDFGAGEGRLNTEGLDMRSLRVDMGVGDLTIDLTGPRRHDLDVDVDGGVGAATLILPRKIEARVRVDKGIGSVDAREFVRRGDYYVSSGSGESDKKISVTISAGIGSIDLRLR